MEAYAPLGSPGRTRKNSLDPVVMEDPVIAEVALRHGASPAQVNSTAKFSSAQHL